MVIKWLIVNFTRSFITREFSLREHSLRSSANWTFLPISSLLCRSRKLWYFIEDHLPSQPLEEKWGGKSDATLLDQIITANKHWISAPTNEANSEFELLCVNCPFRKHCATGIQGSNKVWHPNTLTLLSDFLIHSSLVFVNHTAIQRKSVEHIMVANFTCFSLSRLYSLDTDVILFPLPSSSLLCSHSFAFIQVIVNCEPFGLLTREGLLCTVSFRKVIEFQGLIQNRLAWGTEKILSKSQLSCFPNQKYSLFYMPLNL